MKYLFRYTCILVILLIFSFSSQAQIISSKTAKKVAANFLAEQNIFPKTFHEEVFKSTLSSLYLFNFNQGYIIISDRQEAFPIIGWSTESNFNLSNIPPEVNFWLNSYLLQLEQYSKKPSATTKKNIRYWNRYITGNKKYFSIEEEVKPMLDSYWNQGCYFNSALPIDSTLGSCNHPYTGCVPTALAQILKYYNFPKHGYNSLEISSPYGPLVANFQETYYQWTSMENHISNENPAVAELLYQCVVAVKSQFFPQGTGAYDQDAKEALLNYFDYSTDIQFLMRDSYFGDWIGLMQNELDEGRPFLYGGVDESTMAGHTWVCDGYQDSSFFHINWGWGGQYNGYFYLDSLVAGSQNFNFHHDAIIGIHPNIDETGQLFPPSNLSAEINSNKVTLNWDYPQANSYLDLLGYNVYRDDTLLNNSVITNLYYNDPIPSPGNHNYYVESVFIGNGHGPSVLTEIYISNINNSLQQPFQIALSKDNRRLLLFTDRIIQIENIKLINVTGRIVFNSQNRITFTGNNSWTLPPLAAGIYVIQIRSDQFTYTNKLLIH